MKRLVINTNESVVCGSFHCGIAEVADSLSMSLVGDFDVTVVSLDGNGRIANCAQDMRQLRDGIRTCTLLGVHYVLVKTEDARIEYINENAPELMINFGEIELINKLDSRPQRIVCVLDLVENLIEKIETLEKYDTILTVSNSYADIILSQNEQVADRLLSKGFHGVTNGILGDIFSPEKGIMLPAKYNSTILAGKITCKKRLCEQYGLPYDRYLALVMGRMIDVKGIDGILDNIDKIYNSGGYTLIIGNGDKKYVDRLEQIKRSDGALWLKNKIAPPAVLPTLAGADFLLYPSIMEACGLMPMAACRYGTIPVTTLNGGLADNMNDEIGIIIDSMESAPALMAALYEDKEALTVKRRAAMRADFDWKNRKQGYIEVLQ